MGWLPVVAGVLNALWVLLFQYEWFVVTVPVEGFLALARAL